MFYEFKLGHDRSNQNICCAKGDGTVDFSTIIRWFKKFYLGCKNLDNQASSSKPITKDSKALQTIDANPVSSSQRVSGDL